MFLDGIDFSEFEGDIRLGDLLEIKKGMMLIEPEGPVLVIGVDSEIDVFTVMYTTTEYIINCSRIDIKKVCNLNKD
jgi:hypothetical protein